MRYKRGLSIVLISFILIILVLIAISIWLIFRNSDEGGNDVQPEDFDEKDDIEIQQEEDDCEAGSLLLINPDELVLENPKLINIENKNEPLQLKTYIKNGNGIRELLDVQYSLSHPVSRRIPNVSSIISINSNGKARYNSEGYVYVTASFDECNLQSEPVILATGKVYGNPETDNVLAVFPADFKPSQGEDLCQSEECTRGEFVHREIIDITRDFYEVCVNGSCEYDNGRWCRTNIATDETICAYKLTSEYSFDYTMNNYSYMQFINLAYDIESELYNGFKPYNGAKQILALLELPDHCGGNNNPIGTSSGCYRTSDGTPNYNVVIHEIGHNFGYAGGMQQLLYSNNNRINGAAFGECVASLPVIYIASEIYNNPEKYDISRDSSEWKYYEKFLYTETNDIQFAQDRLNEFQGLINSSTINGIFDAQGYDRVSFWCSFFQSYSYNFTQDANPYKNEIIMRFLNLFSDEEFPNFQEDKVETYFVAAFSAAVGNDVREKLRYWGFTIDDEYYNEVYSQLQEILS